MGGGVYWSTIGVTYYTKITKQKKHPLNTSTYGTIKTHIFRLYFKMFDQTRSMKRVFSRGEAVRQLSACGRLLKNDTNKIESNLLEDIEEEHHILQ